ncbi:hypothetical protein [Allosphingosinicella humi]
MKITPAELNELGAKVVGKVSNKTLRDLLEFVEKLTTIAPETRDVIVDELLNHLGV